MKKAIFAYLLLVLLPIAIVASGIGSPELACAMLLAASALAVVLGAIVIFMPHSKDTVKRHAS